MCLGNATMLQGHPQVCMPPQKGCLGGAAFLGCPSQKLACRIARS
jgi:hypothetical protein